MLNYPNSLSSSVNMSRCTDVFAAFTDWFLTTDPFGELKGMGWVRRGAEQKVRRRREGRENRRGCSPKDLNSIHAPALGIGKSASGLDGCRVTLRLWRWTSSESYVQPRFSTYREHHESQMTTQVSWRTRRTITITNLQGVHYWDLINREWGDIKTEETAETQRYVSGDEVRYAGSKWTSSKWQNY